MTMDFSVLIPARLASSRLPDKPMADLHGQPMVVRVAQRAKLSKARRVVVAADDVRIEQACRHAAIDCVLTDVDHPSGSDRLAQACRILGLDDDEIVVNVQGDEPLIDPELIDAVAHLLSDRRDCEMSTAAHAIEDPVDFRSPHVVKVVTDARQTALYFSRAPIPHGRDFTQEAWWQEPGALWPAPLRHIGIYAYRAGFLARFPNLPPAPMERLESLEQLRALWHGHRIAVHLSDRAPGPGGDTPEDLQRVRSWLAGKL